MGRPTITPPNSANRMVIAMEESDSQNLEQIIRTSLVRIMPGRYAMAKLASAPMLSRECFFCVTTDDDETTVIVDEACLEKLSYTDVQKWFLLVELAVSLPFFAVGFLAKTTNAIAEAGLNVLVISTFSKDYLLLREETISEALNALKNIGFVVNS